MTTYYLNTEGDDSADGLTPGTAWKSLDRSGAGDFRAEDVLLLAAGQVFEGGLRFGAGPPIRIGSYGDGVATIRSGAISAIEISDRSVDIENLRLEGGWDSDSQAGNDSSGLVIACHLPAAQRIQGVKIRNVHASGYKHSGISIRGGGPDRSKSGFVDISIDGCECFRNGGAGISVGGNMEMDSTDYCHRNVLVRNCIAYENRGVLKTGSHSGSGIVISDLKDGLIEWCTAYHNGELNDHPGGGPVGIWCWDCDSVTIQDCESYENRTGTKDGGGFDLDGGATHCVLRRCYSHDNAGPGILICQFKMARPFHHNLVEDNLCIDDGVINGGGIVVYDDWDGISDCTFARNRVFSKPYDGDEVPAPLRLLTHSSNLRFIENTFSSYGDIPVVEAVHGQVGLEMSENVFWNPDSTCTFDWQGAKCSDFEAFKRLSGLENPGDFRDPGRACQTDWFAAFRPLARRDC